MTAPAPAARAEPAGVATAGSVLAAGDETDIASVRYASRRRPWWERPLELGAALLSRIL